MPCHCDRYEQGASYRRNYVRDGQEWCALLTTAYIKLRTVTAVLDDLSMQEFAVTRSGLEMLVGELEHLQAELDARPDQW